MDNNIRQKITKFINNNTELICEYESIDSAIPFEYCIDDMIRLYSNAIKSNKNIDINAVLKDSLKNAIKYDINCIDSMEGILTNISSFNDSTNITQQYFKEINDIYYKNKNKYNIEYCEENRNKLIEMNLKTVIMIAKKYQGLGLSLNELISAGNLGLVVAWDKFDPSRSKLKDDILNSINELNDEFKYEELISYINEYFKYGDVKKKFDEYFKPNHIYTKKEFIRWVNGNIFNAKFNSIATMWIRAYILIEIDNNSRIVKKPKSEIYKDREQYGAYKKEITLDIDAPVADDSDTAVSDMLTFEDDTNTDLEVIEAYNTYKQGLMQLLEGVKPRDRNIFLKKFGIGLPRPLLPKEIAEQEGLSIARISQIFQTVVEQMQKNQLKYNIDANILFDAARKIS